MKTINYLMISTHLPSDSQIMFFNTFEEAKAEFKKQTDELFSLDENLEEDTDYFKESEYAIRFNAGNNESLTNFLEDVDHYFYAGSIEVEDNVNYYVADFSQSVDDSKVLFYNIDEAKTIWNNMVNDAIEMQSSIYRNQEVVSRYDSETWEDEDYGTLFSESINEDGSIDAFFGFTDIYWTYRIGEIKIN